MKKNIITICIMFILILSLPNIAYCNEIDMAKFQTITEIGTLTNKGLLEEALEKCNSAIKKYPKEPELYYWSASIKSDLGDNKSAIEDYNKAIKINPKNSSSIYVMRGIAKSELKDYDGAIKDFNYAISINPDDSSAYSMRACVKIEIGDIEGAAKDLEMANKLLEKIK